MKNSVTTLPTIIIKKLDVVGCECGTDHYNFPILHLPKFPDWNYVFTCPINKKKIRIKVIYD